MLQFYAQEHAIVSGAQGLVLRYFAKIKELIRNNSSSGPREICLKHREYCFTLLEDSRGEIFGEWIIDLDGLCIWRWYEVRSKYLQNRFVYLSSRHVAGFWRLVLSSSWIASCFRNHCSHAQTVYRHLKTHVLGLYKHVYQTTTLADHF